MDLMVKAGIWHVKLVQMVTMEVTMELSLWVGPQEQSEIQIYILGSISIDMVFKNVKLGRSTRKMSMD